MKNLAKHKDKVNARNLVVQAMYEFSFGHNSAEEIEESFRKNFTKTKVDYIFSQCFSACYKKFSRV